ncbi:MAG: hypothetical protein ABFD79_01425 [Phycisphaerales bacterium]
MIIDANRLYEVKEIITKNGGILPLSLSGVYSLVRRGEIDAIHIGKKVLIKGSFLKKLQ